MKRADLQKAAGLTLLVLAAGLYLWRQLWGTAAPGERGFFYDESAKKLFVAARTAVPPIRGIDGPAEDGFRAVVYSVTGDPTDQASWRVAYVEKCSPDLKAKMEAAQQSGESLPMGRMEAQSHRFVRRPDETEWRPMTAPDIELILNAWAVPGPDGKTPVLCTP
jgi:hypothetical protein